MAVPLRRGLNQGASPLVPAGLSWTRLNPLPASPRRPRPAVDAPGSGGGSPPRARHAGHGPTWQLRPLPVAAPPRRAKIAFALLSLPLFCVDAMAATSSATAVLQVLPICNKLLSQVVLFRSTEHQNCGPQPGFVRASIESNSLTQKCQVPDQCYILAEADGEDELEQE